MVGLIGDGFVKFFGSGGGGGIIGIVKIKDFGLLSDCFGNLV